MYLRQFAICCKVNLTPIAPDFCSIILSIGFRNPHIRQKVKNRINQLDKGINHYNMSLCVPVPAVPILHSQYESIIAACSLSEGEKRCSRKTSSPPGRSMDRGKRTSCPSLFFLSHSLPLHTVFARTMKGAPLY